MNLNSGYEGYSRSVRSQEAIENFEMPLAQIDKDVITRFLKNRKNAFDQKTLDALAKVSVSRWKFVATRYTEASSWHHTGKYYNRTDHYDLDVIAERMLEVGLDEIESTYRYVLDQKKAPKEYEYGVIEYQVWGGTRNRPVLMGEEKTAGIIVGDFLYERKHPASSARINKYKVSARKTIKVDRYEQYSDLVKAHKEYVGTKKMFTAVITKKT